MGPKKRPSGGVVAPSANERRPAAASSSPSSVPASSPSSLAASKSPRGAPAKSAVSSSSPKVSNVGGGGAGGNNTSSSSSSGSGSSNNKANQSRAQAAAELAAASQSSASSDSSGSKSKSSESSGGGGVKANEKKDDKAKAINKMLKNLDIKISGFDNILPKEERGETLLKSSISENVKTKSRAAAVKVIANLNPHRVIASGSSRRALQREEPPRKVNRVEEKASSHKEKEEKRRKDEEKEEKRRKEEEKEEKKRKEEEKEERRRKDEEKEDRKKKEAAEKEERKRKDDEKEERKRKDDEKVERKRIDDEKEERKQKEDEKEDKRRKDEEKEDKRRKEEDNVEKKAKEEEKKLKEEEKKAKDEEKKTKEDDKEDKRRKEEDKKAKEHDKEEKKRKEEEKDERKKKLDDRESNAAKTKSPVAPSKDPKDSVHGTKCIASRKTVSPEDSNVNSNKRKYPKTISKESSSSSLSPPSESKKDTNAQNSSVDTKSTEQDGDSVSGKKKYSNLPKSKQNKKPTAPREENPSVGDDSNSKKAHPEPPESKKVKEAEKSSKKELTASKASPPTKHSKSENDKKEKDISSSVSMPEERTPPKSPPPQKPPEKSKSDPAESAKVLPDSNTEPVQMDIEETPVKVAKTADIQPTTKEPLKKDPIENSQKEKDSSRKDPVGGQRDSAQKEAIGKSQKESSKKDTVACSQQDSVKKDTPGGGQKELSKKDLATGKNQKEAEKKDSTSKKVEEKSGKKAEEKTDEKKAKPESEHDAKAAGEKNSGRSSGSGIYKSLHSAQAAKGDKAKPKDGKTSATPTDSSKNDIYDFKSGSEEELNIKMELPTLKNISEFSEDDQKEDKDAKKKADEAKSSGSAKTAAATKGSSEAPKAAVKTPTKTPASCSAALKKSHASVAYTKGASAASAAKNITAYNKSKKSHSPVAAAKQQSKQAAKKSAAEKKKIQEEESASSAESSDSEDAKKLIMFGPKRHRMASLNALAKVQCLYENESRTAYELGLSKATQLPPKMRTLDGSDDEKEVKEPKAKAPVEEKPPEVQSAIKKEDKKITETAVKEEDEPPSSSAKAKAKPEVAAAEVVEELELENKRELRVVPGGRGFGKHWEFYSDSEENEEIERLKLKKKKMQKKLQTKKEKEAAEKPKEKDKAKKKDPEKQPPEKPKEKEKKAAEKRETVAVEKPPEKLKRKYNKVKKPLKKQAKPSKAVSSNDELSSDDLSGQEGSSEKDDKTYNLPKSHPDSKKPPKKRKHVVLREKRELLIGDYKGILARKRMASLNATAIVAATYEVERHLDKNLAYDYTSYSDSSEEEEESRPASPAPKQVKSSKKADTKKEVADEEKGGAKLKHTIKSEPAAKSDTGTSKASVSMMNEESCDSKYSKDTKESTNTDTNTATTAAIRDCSAASLNLGNLVVGGGSGKDGLIRPKSSSVVIVQDTDVTITGVYVNAKSGSSQEAYCKMQYRVQSSVTEERLLRPGSVEPPPKSYTPLSALSSMLPPCASGAAGPPGLLSDVHCASSPGPPSMVTSLTDAINANSIYHSNDLGLHTEHGAPEHGVPPPPPPAYVAAYHTAAANAAAAAAAAAGIHGHHHPLPKQYGLHQYPFQPGQPPGPGERTLHAPMPSTHPHHYPGMSPGGGPHCEQSPQGRCDVGSPPPPSAYRPNSGYMGHAGGPLMPLPPPPTSMTVGSSSSAFCAPQSQHVQHQQQQQQNPGSQHQEQHDGNGYYQPAGPLISSHLLPQPPNVPLLPSVAGPKAKHPAAIPVPLGSDPDQQPPHHLAAHHVPSQAPGAADSAGPPDSHVLITGSDLTPFRYQAGQGQGGPAGGVPPPHPSPHHPHQQPHPLHHQTTAYPRSMHPQMHYSPAAYPPANYYIPYPGEPMCYSAPSAYQPYFSTKVYPNTGPPPPHHPAYRRYPYYPAGPPPPSTHSSPHDHYGEHPAPPPQSAAATSATPPQPPPAGGTPSPSPSALQQQQQSAGGGASGPQASPGPGTQLVPAGHHHGTAAGPPPPPPPHLEHYPGQGYYAPYPAGGASPAGQCYPRTIQPPYMDYPQCPCPMQQSCPKNVHTGPHIGNNRNNNNNSNSSSSSNNNTSSNNNVIISRNSCSNAATMTSAASTTTTTTMAASANSCNTNNSNNTNITSTMNNNNTASNNYLLAASSSPARESSHTNEDSTASANLNPTKLPASGGVVPAGAGFAANESSCKNLISLNTNRGPVTNNNNNNTTNADKQANLLQKVKSELKVELPDSGRGPAKSQYEENVQPPPTPPESYGTLEDDEKEERYAAAIAQLGEPPKTLPMPMPTPKEASLSSAPEAYDLTSSGQDASTTPNGLSMPTAAAKVVVGRKARIGKTMAREMMYAGVANAAAATSMASPLAYRAQVAPSATAEPPQFESSQRKKPAAAADSMEPLLLLKAKIKTEKIKQEEQDFPMVLASTAECTRSELAPEMKAIIKTEPSEAGAEPLKATVAAADDVLDLCRSPLPGGGDTTDAATAASKRLNILEGAKGGCKKSPSSSYKSLIKQAEPRAYLCLSRKRTQRYRKSHWRSNVAGTLRRRHINLTEQQKKRLRMRNRKLFDVEKRRQEMIEKRRSEGRLKAMKDADSPAAASDSTTTTTASSSAASASTSCSLLTKDGSVKESTPQDVMLAGGAAASNGDDFMPLALNSPLRCRKALLNGLQASEDVLGYYSDPETRCSGGVKSLFRAKDETAARCMPASLTSAAAVGAASSGERKHGCAGGYEKRSKSETKKPIRATPADVGRLGPGAKTVKLPKEQQKVKAPKEPSCATPQAVDPTEETTAKSKGKSLHKDGGVNKQSSAAKKAKLSGERKSLLLEEAVAEPLSGSATPPETNNNEYEQKGAVDAAVTPASRQTPNCEVQQADESVPAQAEPPQQEQPSLPPPPPSAQQFQAQHSESTVFLAQTAPLLPRIGCHAHNHYQTGSGKRSKRTKFGRRKKPRHSTVSFELDDTLPPARGDVIPKWNNGWMWEGEPFQGAVFLNSDDHLVIRTCYPAMRHSEGDIIRARDCVLLKANEDNELPYVAKVAHLWENPEDGEMMMSLLWYYRPEHTEQGRQLSECPDEVYASRHRDHNSVACIEDKCYVLTFNEYCRYRRRLRAAEEDIEDWNIVPKRASCYTNSRSLPPINTNPELVMFCRRAYEFRTKRLMKMPSKQDYYVVTA